MINNFLNQYKLELLTEKDKCNQELEGLNLKLKESIYHLNACQRIYDENYKSFSPRKIITNNDSKIEFYNNEVKNTKLLLQKKCKELSDFDNRISEINGLIKINIEHDKFININSVNSDEFRMKILETQECERQRIARDLHDSIIQNLVHLVHNVELSSKLIDVDPIRTKLQFVKMEKSIRDIISEMRKVIFDLHPMAFEDIGVDISIERELDKLKEVGNLNITFEIEGNRRPVKPVVGITIVRIIQEVCNNIFSHSDATIAIVVLKYGDDYVEVKIIDNGKGFELKNCNSISDDCNSGFGIPMMKERIYLLSGEINIESEVNKGTSVYIKVPV